MYTQKSTKILTGISQGMSYEQILAANGNEITYKDIFYAASQALSFAKTTSRSIRQSKEWDETEIEILCKMFNDGVDVGQIASSLHRNRRTCIRKLTVLGMITSPSLNIDQESVFSRLKVWRNNIAEKDGVPSFKVFTDKKLALIASSTYESADDPLFVKIVGRKYGKFGKEVFDLLH